jgi:hypothetical protein
MWSLWLRLAIHGIASWTKIGNFGRKLEIAGRKNEKNAANRKLQM